MRWLSLFALLSAPGLSWAEPDSSELPVLVVSAARVPIPQAEAGSAITVISREQLERRQSAFLADVLRNVPGVAVSRSGTLGSTTQVRIRGAEANHVLVVIDGVEINDPSLGDEVDFAHLMTHDIERVEVVRGPQSALWGSDAVAGVINIVTRSAAGESAARGFVDGGSFSTWNAGAGLGLVQDRLTVDGGVSYLETDGTNISRSGDEDDGYANLTVNFKAKLAVSDRLELRAFLRHTDVDKDFDAIDFFTTGLPTDADRETEIQQSYGRFGGTFRAGSWIHRFGVTVTDTDNENFADGSFDSSQAGQKVGLQWQSTLSWAQHSLTAAIEREDEEFEQRGTATFFGDPNQDQDMDTTALVFEYRTRLWERLSLSLGGRYDDNSDFDDAATYRVAASLPITDAARLRASVATGQKRPTFTERFGFFADQFIGNPDLQPEESVAWEVALEQQLGKVRFEIGYFDEQLEDEINGFVFDPNTFLFTAENQGGKSDRRGVELSVRSRLSDRVDLASSYAYTHADEPAAAGGSQRELRRPRHQASLNLNSAALAERLNLNLNVTYNSEQLDLFFPPFPQPSQRLELSGFALLNLAAHYRLSERLRLVARVENLLDEDYEEVVGFAEPGRAAYLGIRFGL